MTGRGVAYQQVPQNAKSGPADQPQTESERAGLAAGERSEIRSVNIVHNVIGIVMACRVDHREANRPLPTVKRKPLLHGEVQRKVGRISKTVWSLDDDVL